MEVYFFLMELEWESMFFFFEDLVFSESEIEDEIIKEYREIWKYCKEKWYWFWFKVLMVKLMLLFLLEINENLVFFWNSSNIDSEGLLGIECMLMFWECEWSNSMGDVMR